MPQFFNKLNALPKISRKASFFLKGFVSLFLLFVLVKRIHWQSFLAYRQQLDERILFWLLAGFAVNVFLSVWRWNVILKSFQMHYHCRILTRIYLIGMFWNTFLPSTIGGDGYRILAINRYQKDSSAWVVASVLLDRLYGLVALFLFNFALVILFWAEIRLDSALLAIEGLLLVLALSGMLFLFFFRQQNRKMLRYFAQYKPGRKLQELLDAIQMSGWQVAAKGVGISMLFVLVSGLIWWGAYLMFVDIKPLPVIFASVLANISGLLPVSINGIGVNEGVAFYVLNKWGVSAESVLGASIVIRLILGVIALLGGLLYLLDSSSE